MNCPKCDWENPDSSTFCNKCGFKLDYENHEDKINPQPENSLDETIENVVDENATNDSNLLVQESEKAPKKKKTMLIVSLVILIILLAVGGAIGYKIYDDKKKEEEAQAAYDKYELSFLETTVDILTEAYLSQAMCGIISDTWRNAIDDRKDFNTEISNVYSAWRSKGILDERANAKDDLEKSMKGLQKPPKDYEEAYKLMVELYGLYSQIYSQATAPQGSLMTYNQDVNQKSSEFDKIFEKMKVLKPDIEAKMKENK